MKIVMCSFCTAEIEHWTHSLWTYTCITCLSIYQILNRNLLQTFNSSNFQLIFYPKFIFISLSERCSTRHCFWEGKSLCLTRVKRMCLIQKNCATDLELVEMDIRIWKLFRSKNLDKRLVCTHQTFDELHRI